jgi:hypothetical protein
MPKIHRIFVFAVFTLLAAIFAARPALAQVDLSGGWLTKIHEDENDRSGGPDIGDYTGLPLNDAARLKADTWDAEESEMLDHRCQQPPADYAARGQADMRMWSEMDPLTKVTSSWNMLYAYMLTQRTIYMDGRPHPSANAPHTWEGFSTGEWEGQTLKVTTTHLKEGRIRKNGVARSAQATVIEYYTRYHNVLTLTTVIKDPVYMTEPLIRTTSWVVDDGFDLKPKHDHCLPTESVPHPDGYVAFHLPGKNPWLSEFASKWQVPFEATRGGAETMYPEYQIKLETMPAPPMLPAEK